MDAKEIGARIEAARRSKGWTQVDLAAQMRVSPSSVQRWERGEVPRVRKLYELAELFELPIEHFIQQEPLVLAHDPGYERVLEELAQIRGDLARLLAREDDDGEGRRPARGARRRPA